MKVKYTAEMNELLSGVSRQSTYDVLSSVLTALMVFSSSFFLLPEDIIDTKVSARGYRGTRIPTTVFQLKAFG